MSPIYTKDGKILKQDNKISVNQNCCCGDCPTCTGSTCCNEEYPRQIGYCCENVWRLPTDIGGCCSGIWYDEAGTCCNEEWHAESGVCCGTTWFPTPEDVSLPVWPNPYNPWERYPGVSWETEICPSGTLFAVYGKYGECCGCVPTGIYDPSVGYEVPWADISQRMCCNCTNTPYVDEYGCLGNCCVEGDCTTVAEQQCNPFAHPTNPTYLPEDYWKYLWEPNCCSLNRCSVDQCCVNGRLVNRVTFEVTGDIISTPEGCGGDVPCGSTWILDPGFDIELDDPLFYGPGVEQKIFAQIGWNVPEEADLEMVAGTLYNLYLTALLFSYGGQPSSWGVNGNTITISGPSAINGTITYIPPLGQTVVSGPISSSTSISRPECIGVWGGWPIGDPLPIWSNGWENAINCPCRSEEIGFRQREIAEKCCRTVKSSGLGLTFTKPNTNGSTSFSGTAKVTVTGTTTSPILVHGTLFGTNATPDKKCPFQHTFVLCNGIFNIEPVPCGSSFHNLEVEVCYEKHAITSESFNFSGCNNIQVNLGSCPASCTTTMNYTGPGHTSNATIVLTGSAIIAANGTGPLVLTNNWVPACPLNPGLDLTLTGTNTQNNKLEGCRSYIEGAAYPRLRKDGPGTWWVPGKTCTTFQGFANTGYILDGTLVIQNSRFLFDYSSSGSNESEIVVGEQGYSGEVRCFVSLDPESINGVSSNVRVRSTIIVSPGLAQRVLLGAHPEGSPLNSDPPGFIGGTDTGVIELVGDVTLVAPTNRTIEFTGTWKTASQTPATKNIRIGHPDFLGTIMLGGIQETTGVVSIEYGKLLLKQGPGSPQFKFTTSLLKIDSNCELIIGQSRTVNSPIELTGNATIISGAGTLDLVSMIISGSDHTVSSIVAINSNATITGNGNMLISGIVSGSSTLTMNGSGTISLSGNNSFNGTTIINSGTMKANSLLAFGTSQIVVNAGGTLDKNGFAITNTITNNGGIIIN